MLTYKDATVIYSLHTANIFDYYFSSIAEKTIVNIKFSNKLFQNFLHHLNEQSLFIAAADAHAVHLMSSLNSNKYTGPNSLQTKIIKLWKNYISTHLAGKFSTGVFPFMLKTTKVVPVHQKKIKAVMLKLNANLFVI